MTKKRIAILISLLLAPAAVVAQYAATESSTESSMQATTEVIAVEQTVVVEPVAVIETTESTTVIAEPVAVETTVVVQTTVAAAPIEHPQAPSYTLASLYTSSWPQGSFDSEYWKPLPAQSAFLEQRDQQRASMIASLGQGFPDGSATSESRQLPHMAYFDQGEQQIAASRSPLRLFARSSSSERSAQAGSAELAMADTSTER